MNFQIVRLSVHVMSLCCLRMNEQKLQKKTEHVSFKFQNYLTL